jgi:hypothetical protein
MKKQQYLILAVLLVFFCISGLAEANVLNVANNGVDSNTCGPTSNPCRSISKAIAHAINGDTIKVGPGRYGDVNKDGIFNPTSGEESAEVGYGCDCMIKVDKQLTIESLKGALSTILDAGGVDVAAIQVEASNVVFGRIKGFTITGAGRSGLIIRETTSTVTVQNNMSMDNKLDGFVVLGSGHIIKYNMAARNFDETGFRVDGSNHTLTHNVTSNNLYGFILFGDGHKFIYNTAVSNLSRGFEVGYFCKKPQKVQ